MCHLLVAQGDIDGTEVVDQLLLLARANNGAGDAGLVQEPGQCDLRDRCVLLFGNLPQHVEDLETLIPVEMRIVELRAAALSLTVAGILAA